MDNNYKENRFVLSLILVHDYLWELWHLTLIEHKNKKVNKKRGEKYEY